MTLNYVIRRELLNNEQEKYGRVQSYYIHASNVLPCANNITALAKHAKVKSKEMLVILTLEKNFKCDLPERSPPTQLLQMNRVRRFCASAKRKHGVVLNHLVITTLNSYSPTIILIVSQKYY